MPNQIFSSNPIEIELGYQSIVSINRTGWIGSEDDTPSQYDGEELIIPMNYNTITIVIDYPLNNTARFVHNSTNENGGFSRKQIAELIAADYQRIYTEENNSTTITPGMMTGTYNRNTTNGIWGIWGHVIDDLVLGGISAILTDSNELEISCTVDS